MTPQPCRIYRIVHFENLRQILERGSIGCAHELMSEGRTYVQIGDQSLTANRSDKQVPIPPGGTLNDYVPFYFCPRSVMLFQIHTGYVPTYVGGQEEIVHLVSTVEDGEKEGLPFVFTDRHAKLNVAKFFNKRADLDELNWEAIGSRDWKRRDDQPDRQDVKQAEFLVHGSVPWSCIRGIGVYSKKWMDAVRELLGEFGMQTRVAVKPSWYY